jgi:hypothetical protein
MGELITQREYARRRDVSPAAVCKAIKTGRIRLIYGKIDPDLADREWAANTNGGQALRSAAIAAGATIASGGAPLGGSGGGDGSEPGPPGAGPPSNGIDYGQQRALHESYRARTAELEFKMRAGEVVDAERVRAIWFNNARRARDMILAIPDRLAPIVAAEGDRFEVHRIMLEEFRRVCDQIASVEPI